MAEIKKIHSPALRSYFDHKARIWFWCYQYPSGGSVFQTRDVPRHRLDAERETLECLGYKQATRKEWEAFVQEHKQNHHG